MPGTRSRRLLRGAAYLVAWLVLALGAGLWLFLGSERTINVASHDARVSPDLSGWATVHTGPVLPDLRVPTGGRVGVDVQLGKTEAPSMEALVERYAFIASQPEGPVEKLRESVRSMAMSAAVRGALLGAVPVAVWVLLGRDRRSHLGRTVLTRRGTAVGLTVVVVVAVALTAVRSPDERSVAGGQQWVSLPEFLGEQVRLPEDVRDVEVLRSVTTQQTRRLVLSAIDTYRYSKEFYVQAAEDAGELDLRRPEEGETTVVLVADRHLNVGMDAVARAVGDRAGATGILNAGDDTSTGSRWEAFSLDSIAAAFADFDRWVATGNHDHGDFVPEYFADRGWTVLDGETVEGPAGGRMLGVGDPRSSGLGNWRDESGLSFRDVATRLADAACEAAVDGERVNTMLVHDHNLGRPALEQGCVDLVVGGHTHVREGPTPVVGENGETGYFYVSGTTGGAAYAIAIGSKLRRDASITVVTYDEEGRPAGVQPVTLQTNGRFTTGEYEELAYEAPDAG